MSQRRMSADEINSYLKNLKAQTEINKLLGGIVQNVETEGAYRILNKLPLNLKGNIQEGAQRMRIKKLLKEIEAENQNSYRPRSLNKRELYEMEQIEHGRNAKEIFSTIMKKRRGNNIKKKRMKFLQEEGKKNHRFWGNQLQRADDAGRNFHSWQEYQMALDRIRGVTRLEPPIVVPEFRRRPSLRRWHVPWLTNNQRRDWGIPPRNER